MGGTDVPVVVGLDNGGTSNNATVLDAAGGFLVDGLVEIPSRVQRGAGGRRSRRSPDAFDAGAGADRGAARGGARGRARHARPGERRRRDLLARRRPTSPSRLARLRLPRPRSRSGSACRSSTTTTATPPRSTPTTSHFGAEATQRSSVSAIVGTGLGGGVVEAGQVVRARPAWPASSATCTSRWTAAREPDQPVPQCNCGFAGDAESVASLTGDRAEPAAVLARPLPRPRAGRRGRRAGRPSWCVATASGATRWPCEIFEQQAMALGRLFTIAANFTDPHAYFVGGGVVEAAPRLPRLVPRRRCGEHTLLREEQAASATSPSCPTSTWPAPGARRSRRWRRCGRVPRPARSSRADPPASRSDEGAPPPPVAGWRGRSSRRAETRRATAPPAPIGGTVAGEAPARRGQRARRRLRRGVNAGAAPR